MKTMTCDKCVYSLTREQLDADEIESFDYEAGYLIDVLREGETIVKCTWSDMVLGSMSICSDVEIPDE